MTHVGKPNFTTSSQGRLMVPTALPLTACSVLGYTALGAGIGRAALGAVFNATLRRVMAACFIIYGLLLGSTSAPRIT